MELMDLPPIDAPQMLKLGNVEVTLTNELVQKVNDRLEISFTTPEPIELVLANLDQKEAIVYAGETYTEYIKLIEFGFKIGIDDRKVYRAVLVKPDIKPSLAKAIEIAKVKAPDSDVVEMADLLDTFDSFVGKPIKKGTRFTHNGSVYKAINNVESVSAALLPGESSDFKKL